MVKKDKPNAKQKDPNERLITENRKARFDYEVIDTLECGMVLMGSEVKTLRGGKVSLEESFARVLRNEVFLVGCEIPEYKNASIWNHEPKRMRKLLIHREEIRKFADLADEKGLTLIPLKMYFKAGVAKVLLGLCKGRKNFDKREKLKSDSAKRDIARAMRRG